MSLDADVRHLAAVRPFAALPREALQLLAFSCPRRALKAGERLFGLGDPAVEAYFVLDGELILRTDGGERRVGAGVLIGESALLVETVRPAEATAARDSALLRIPGETFRRVLSEFPDSAAAIHRAMSARARGLIDNIERVRRRAFLAEA